MNPYEKELNHIGDETGALVPTVPFDYETIDVLFSPSAVARLNPWSVVADAWSKVLHWLFGDNVENGYRRARNGITLRLVAMAWALCPELFNGQTLTEIARRFHVGKAALSRYVVMFSEEFGFVTRGMKRVSDRQAYRVARLKKVKTKRLTGNP